MNNQKEDIEIMEVSTNGIIEINRMKRASVLTSKVVNFDDLKKIKGTRKELTYYYGYLQALQVFKTLLNKDSE